MSTPPTNLWYLAVPPPTVPLPAASVPDLRGRRVIVGTDGGFRGDLVAGSDAHVRDDGRVHVGILSEYDRYRAHLADVDVALQPTPIERVWVEHRLAASRQPPADGGSAHYDWALLHDTPVSTSPEPTDAQPTDALLARLVTLDAPPGRTPRRAADQHVLTGCRVVLVNPGEFRYDSRAISEPYRRADGIVCVNIVTAHDWYAWAITGAEPQVADWPIERVWVD